MLIDQWNFGPACQTTVPEYREPAGAVFVIDHQTFSTSVHSGHARDSADISRLLVVIREKRAFDRELQCRFEA
jgi:hypothetical protein